MTIGKIIEEIFGFPQRSDVPEDIIIKINSFIKQGLHNHLPLTKSRYLATL